MNHENPLQLHMHTESMNLVSCHSAHKKIVIINNVDVCGSPTKGSCTVFLKTGCQDDMENPLPLKEHSPFFSPFHPFSPLHSSCPFHPSSPLPFILPLLSILPLLFILSLPFILPLFTLHLIGLTHN